MKDITKYINESLIEEGIVDKIEKIQTAIYKKLNSKKVTNAGTIVVTQWFNEYEFNSSQDGTNPNFMKHYNDIAGRIVEVIKRITGIRNPKEEIFHAYASTSYIFDTGITDKNELDKLWSDIFSKVKGVCGNEVNDIKEKDNVFRASKLRNEIKELEIELLPELQWYTYIDVEMYVEDSLY